MYTMFISVKENINGIQWFCYKILHWHIQYYAICWYANFNQPQSNRPFINCRPQIIEMSMSLRIFRIVAPLKAKYFRNEYKMAGKWACLYDNRLSHINRLDALFRWFFNNCARRIKSRNFKLNYIITDVYFYFRRQASWMVNIKKNLGVIDLRWLYLILSSR